MKTLLKLALAGGALSAAFGANASQLALPNTDNGSLLLYVTDTATHSTYTVQLTGQSVQGGNVAVGGVSTATNGYFTSADALSSTTQGVINSIGGDTNFALSLSGDTGLENFITNNGGASSSSLVWGVFAGAYVSSNKGAQGNTLVITTGTDANIVNVGNNGLETVVGDLNSDENKLNTNYGSSGDGYSSPGTPNGVFGTTSSAGGTNLTLYGTGVPTGQTLGTSAVTLYGLTTNGSGGGDSVAFDLGSISFNGSQLSFTGNTVSAVPLPPAAWLFGSGLLGLLGIGRRRERLAVAAA